MVSKSWTFLLTLLLMTGFLSAECKARIDIGPAFANVDMIENGKTARTLNLWGIKADASFLIYKGLCLKPSFFSATGQANLNNASIGLGFSIPVTDCFCVTPSFGYSETHYKSRISFPDYGLFHLREKFVSRGKYICLDFSWTFIEKWRLYGLAQYSWSRVHSHIVPILKHKNNTEGPNFALAIERDINEHFSVSLGAAYNSSLSHEKIGLRGKGLKLGLVYWY